MKLYFNALMLFWAVPTVCTFVPQAMAEELTEAQAKALIEDLGQRAIQIFSNKTPASQKRPQFQQLFESFFNGHAIARSVLGVRWNKASYEEKKQYVDLFKSDIVNTYFNLLEKYYKNDRFVVLKAERSKNDPYAFMVLSEIHRANGQTVSIKWHLLGSETTQVLVVDAIVEGASTSNAKRQEYMALFRKHGGTMAGFIQGLRGKVSRLKEGYVPKEVETSPQAGR